MPACRSTSAGPARARCSGSSSPPPLGSATAGRWPRPARKQGTGTTPLGTYTMTETFGNGAAPSTSMPYHRVVSGDYWVQDRKSAYYNTLRNKASGGFRWSLPSSSKDSSEKLSAYPKQYRYAVVINFNRSAGRPDHRARQRDLPACEELRRNRGVRRDHEESDEDRDGVPASGGQDHHRAVTNSDPAVRRPLTGGEPAPAAAAHVPTSAAWRGAGRRASCPRSDRSGSTAGRSRRMTPRRSCRRRHRRSRPCGRAPGARTSSPP